MKIWRIAGSPDGLRGMADGLPNTARFDGPTEVCLHPDGSKLYVADHGNLAIRVIDLDTWRTETLCTLPWHPTHLTTVDGSFLYVTTYTLDPVLTSCIVTVNTSDGTYSTTDVTFVADPDVRNMAGALVVFGGEVWMKYPLGTFVSGWWTIGGEPPGDMLPMAWGRDVPTDACALGPYSFQVRHRDGAYPADAGACKLPGLGPVMAYHQYVYPSNVGISAFGGGSDAHAMVRPHYAKTYNPDDDCFNRNDPPCDFWGHGCGIEDGSVVHRAAITGANFTGTPFQDGITTYQLCPIDDHTAAGALWNNGYGTIQRITFDGANFVPDIIFPEFQGRPAIGIQYRDPNTFFFSFAPTGYSTGEGLVDEDTSKPLNTIWMIEPGVQERPAHLGGSGQYRTRT